MFRKTVLFLVLLSTISLCAQQAPVKAADGQSPSPAELDKLIKAVVESFYHPDFLAEIDCDVSVDWTPMYTAQKTELAPDKLKMLQGLKTHVHAFRQQRPATIFNWANGTPETKNQIEHDLQRSLQIFFQIYWTTFGVANMTSSSITKVEPAADGRRNIYVSEQGAHLIVTIDQDNAPVHYGIGDPATVGLDLSYVATPTPLPGDLRRLSEAKLSQQSGSATLNFVIKLDYQPVENFNIPHHATIEMPGEAPMPLEFTSCSVKKIVMLKQKSGGV